ncbi:S41 family peptidase [Limnoglobus roseus]|uniref:S41 family peptidase n=1 Tax=Limnoglobus roseus TaxID=2598579 RepID=A0A5C1AE38_9BACT|nr:S41 family peptidase [Limnoglobus roseus]QEL16980.1 S41 family peptidase [Limnoglobus roseus]
MPTRRPLRILSLLTTLLFALAATAAPNATPKPQSPEALLTRAADAEKTNDWEKALELYLQAYLSGRQTPEVRDRIATAHRYAAQTRRHRDPAFQQQALALPTAEALDLYAKVLEKLANAHVDRERATPGKLFLAGVDEFDRALTSRTFRREYLPDAGEATVAKFRRTLQEFWKPQPPTTVLKARSAAVELIRAAQAELGLKVSSAVVLELLCGACNSLDEYTVYLSPTPTGSDAAGIAELATYGVIAAVRNGQLIVDRVVPESWAAQNTALQAGDRIGRVNGRSMQSATTAGLTDALRLPTDGAHELEVATLDTTVTAPTRLPTPLPSVQQASILSMKDGVGYIKLASFGESTLLELDAAMARLKDQGMRSLVLDLRGNTGGHFLTGVRVVERFLPSGIIATTESQIPEFANRVFSSDSGMMAHDLPVVLLIDTKTMSAAEVVAMAFKDHSRATIVGMPSFGKGVVQFPFKLAGADGPDVPGTIRTRSGTLVITIAKVLTASGTPLHRQGVLPDLVEADAGRQLALALERAAFAAGMR